MPCDAYRLLESKFNAARNRWTQVANSQNRRLLGVPERQRKQIAKEEKAAMDRFTDLMSQHRANCEACKAKE